MSFQFISMGFLSAFLLTCFFATQTLAHKGDHHANKVFPSDFSGEVLKKDEASIKEIRETYIKNIQPIFSKKCMDCHSIHTQYPWYYKIPGIKQYIDHDISEGREHLDLTQGFPFKSHATMEEDLTDIRDSIQNGSMPPFAYRFLHPEATVTDYEKEKVFDWVDHALSKLNKREKEH